MKFRILHNMYSFMIYMFPDIVKRFSQCWLKSTVFWYVTHIDWWKYSDIFRNMCLHLQGRRINQSGLPDCRVLHLRKWCSSKSVLPLNCVGRKIEAAEMVTRYCSPHFLKTIGGRRFMLHWHSYKPLLIGHGYSWFCTV